MKISGKHEKELQSALLKAFPTESSLAQMVRFGMDEYLEHVAKGNNLADIVFQLICWARSQDRLHELLAAARAANPNSPELIAFKENLNKSSGGPTRQRFRRRTRKKQQRTSYPRNKIDNMVADLYSALLPLRRLLLLLLLCLIFVVAALTIAAIFDPVVPFALITMR